MCLPFTHKWEIKKEEEISRHRHSDSSVIGYIRRVMLVCTRCGHVKFVKHEITT